MSAVVVILVALLVGTMIRHRVVVAQLRAEARVATLVARDDDDDVLAMLEAQASTSALAARLLAQARGESPAGLLTAGACPAAAGLAEREEQWALIWRQYEIEKTDAGCVQAVNRYLEAGIEFSDYEKTQLLSQVSDENLRDEVRRALYPAKKKRKGRRGHRWSARPFTMLCTMTCACGRPAAVLRGPELELTCRCQKRPVRTGVKLSAEMIFVNPDGKGWRCADKKWHYVSPDEQ